LQQLAFYNIIRLVWVPGYCVVPDNKIANALARNASATHFIGPEPFLGVGTMMVQKEIRVWGTKEQFHCGQIPRHVGTQNGLLNILERSSLNIPWF